MKNLSKVYEQWKTADEFYRDRDNRTTLEVEHLTRYATHPVEILIDPHTAHVPYVQQIALLACNLTARWARRVRVCAPNVSLAGQLVRDGHALLVDRISSEMRDADPFGNFTFTELRCLVETVEDKTPLRLFIGSWVDTRDVYPQIHQEDYFVDAAAWTTYGKRGGGILVERAGEATAAAAALAASLGVTDLFKRAVGHARAEWLPNFAWCTWSNKLSHLNSEAKGSRHATQPLRVLPLPGELDLGRMLLAGVGAIGSALIYMADFMPLSGQLTLLDRDLIEASNLNRSPLFTVMHALEPTEKTLAAREYLASRSVEVSAITGTWNEQGARLAEESFDLWISLTNEDGAWAMVPFQLPPVVLHGTTTSGWGFSAGRHIPRFEDCTLCRMPRPTVEFRGPCAEGEVAKAETGPPVRASLPFLSAASAALVLAEMLKLCVSVDVPTMLDEVVFLPNDVAADLRYGLPAVVALKRISSLSCRGCGAAHYSAWEARGGRGRYRALSEIGQLSCTDQVA
jgi:hypothetical protein